MARQDGDLGHRGSRRHSQVAEGAGDSVEGLFRWYAKCLDGRKERKSRLIERALSDHERPDPAGQPMVATRRAAPRAWPTIGPQLVRNSGHQ